MIPSIHNSRTQITQIEIENEIKTTKTETIIAIDPVNETPEQEDTEKRKDHDKIINMENVNRGVSNVQEDLIDTAIKNVNRKVKVKTNFKKVVKGVSESSKRPLYPSHFWVQFAAYGGSGGGSSLSYEPGRNMFVLLVFSIVAIMLSITTMIVGSVLYDEALREQCQQAGLFVIVPMIGMIIINFTFVCSGCARVLPCNIILLVLTVFCMTMMASFITARYRTEIVFLAMLSTIATVIVCMCLACTSFDFTHYLLYVVAISAALASVFLIVSITSLVTGTRYKPLMIVLLILATILNVVSLIMELQMILGGRTVELSEDDYALGAFMLYTSIINMFLTFVQLFGLMDDD